MQCSTGTARNARVTARSLRSPYRRILWTTPRTRAHNARMHTTLISSCAPHDADHGGVCSAVCHAPQYSHAGCTSQRIARVIPSCIECTAFNWPANCMHSGNATYACSAPSTHVHQNIQSQHRAHDQFTAASRYAPFALRLQLHVCMHMTVTNRSVSG